MLGTAVHKTVNRPAAAPPAASRFVQRKAAEARSRARIQPSLKVSSPKDPAEKEAEATAKKIMRMTLPESSVAFVKTGMGGGVFRQVKPEEKEKKLQRRFESPYITRFAACGIFTQKAEKEEKKILRKAEGQPNVASNVAADIQSSLATGAPLPLSVRRFMEPRFRADFSNVRLHTGEKSARLNRHLSAQAFTLGNNIFFGKDKFRPESSEGKELIAHELTHTIQQGAAAQRSEDATVTQQSPALLQRLGLSDALDYFADKANMIPGFRMFTIVLGVNPINMSRVERSAANIMRAIVEFLPGGGLITQALDNHGVFDKVGNWVEQQIRSLGMVGSAIKQAVMDFLDSLSWTDIFDLGGVWNRAKRIFTDPIDRIISFVKGLVTGIIKFVKDAILRPLASLAEGTRGYDLLKAILGEDPVTGDPVPRTADTLIGGFMKLIGQEEIWNNLKKANALARAWAWFQGAMAGLLGFVRQIPSLFLQAFQSLELMDIVLVPRAFAKVAAVFGNFIGSFISWAGNAVWTLLQIIFEVVAPGVIPYIQKAAGAFRTILRNPISFVGNLVRAGKLGFQQFAGNIGKHLKASLIGWLTGALGGAGVYIPQSFEIREIIKMVLSILGLTWQNIRQKLVRAVGETAVKAMETAFDIVVTLVTQGPAAAWEKIKEQLSNLKEMILEEVMNFVVVKIVQSAVLKLVSMLNPAGAIIQAIIAIYNTIMFFIERLRQIAQVAMSFIDSIAAIAGGVVAAAANRVEQTMAGLLTLVISFLARLIGLGKVSDVVINIVNKIRAPIDRALDKVVEWILNTARRLGRFVAQAGVPQDPNERLRLASQAAVAAARRLSGRATQAVLQPILQGIKLRYGLRELTPYEEAGGWKARASINPIIVVDLGLTSSARPTEGANLQPIIGKLTQAIAMFTVWARRGTSPVAQQMLRELEIAREEAQALQEAQSRGVMSIEPRKQALANRLRNIQTLDPSYALISIGEMSVTIVTARRQMPEIPVPPWTMLDPTLRPEYVRQLQEQQDGLNSMMVDQWQQNRDRYRISGRSAVGTRMQRIFQQRSGRPPATAAPHSPDQAPGGFADPTGLPASAAVNSHIGSQWPSRLSTIDTAVNAVDPAARLVTQMNARLQVV